MAVEWGHRRREQDHIFCFKIFFSYFPPLKPRFILWSGASYSPKITVSSLLSSFLPLLEFIFHHNSSPNWGSHLQIYPQRHSITWLPESLS